MNKQQNSQQQQVLIDQIALSPLQKFKKYGRFPWEIIVTLLAIICTVASIQSSVLNEKTQLRQVGHFFNYHLLQHDSYDIYQGSNIFTWRTHQYRNFSKISDFFDRTLNLFININVYGFYQVNQTELNNTDVGIQRFYQNGAVNNSLIQLSILADSQQFGQNLKKSLENIKRMTIIFNVNNLTLNVGKVEIMIQIEIKQHFIFSLRLDQKFYNTTFLEYNRQENITQLDQDQAKSSQQNLQIRKVPNFHHSVFHPINLTILFEVILIFLTLKSISNRYFLYKQNPIKINNICNGEPFQQLSLRNKIKLLGDWNILMILICIACLSGGGVAGFLTCIQLIRYLEYSQNPYLITFLFRKALFLQLILLMNIFIVLAGYVFYSMVVYTQTKKFQSVKLSFFQYLFNNYQYGIYQNFLAIQNYGWAAQFVYFMFLFYMVSCANNIMVSLLCNIVIQKGRYEDLREYISQIKMECPVCGHITNKSRKKIVKQSSSGFLHSVFADDDQQMQEQVRIDVASPTLSPFFTPSTLPKKYQKQQEIKLLKKQTLFQIKGQEQLLKKAKKQNENIFKLIVQKAQFLTKEFESYMLQLQIIKTNKHKTIIARQLFQSQTNFYKILNKLEKMRNKKGFQLKLSPIQDKFEQNSPLNTPVLGPQRQVQQKSENEYKINPSQSSSSIYKR